MTAEELKTKRIFISYGHDRYFPLAARLAEDLKQYVASVWFDKDNIRSFSPSWSADIESGIENCDIVLALMTKHAYRRPAGICTNEIIYASNRNKTIRPILLENMEIPLLLCAIQYFDINDVFDVQNAAIREARYQERFEKLLNALLSGEVDFNGYLYDLKKYLAPQNSMMEISSHTKNFVGREWMFEACNRWIDSDESNILAVVGKPGSGKSSFISKFVMTNPCVKGLHYCHYYNENSTKAAAIIRSIAYHLVLQVNEYADFFGDVNLAELASMPIEELFNTLIVIPLSSLHCDVDKVVIAIDAIDEMPESELRMFIKQLAQHNDKLPKWFKLIITSRPSNSLTNQIKAFKPIYFDVESAENIDDIRALIRVLDANKQLSDDRIEEIIKRSEGIVQYIVEIFRCFDAATLSEHIPYGLNDVYYENFERFFRENDYSNVRKFLEVLCAAREPLSKEEYEEICDSYDIAVALRSLGTYLVLRDNKFCLFHKSMYDWLSNAIDNPKYCVSVSEGNASLCNWIQSYVYSWDSNDYVLQHGFAHLAAGSRFDTIAELLNRREPNILDSFVNFLFEELNKVKIDRTIINTIRFVLKNVKNCDYIFARAVKVFVERGAPSNARRTIVDCCSLSLGWIESFCEMCEARNHGEWTRLIEIGKALVGQVSDADILLEIYDYLGDAYRLTGDHENAFFFYKNAIDGVPEKDRGGKCFFSIYNYYDLRYVRGFLTEASTEIRKYGAQISGDKFKLYKMYRLLGNIEFQKGNKSLALDFFEKTYSMAKASKRPYSVAEALYSVAECLVGVDNERARILIEESRGISEKINSEYNYAKTYFASVERLINMERWEDALVEGAIGVEKLTAVGYLTGATRVKRNMAIAYYNLHDYEQAIEFALCAVNRYKARSSYPIARLNSYLTILKSAKQLNCLEQYSAVDDITQIANVSEFPNAAEIISEIHKVIGSN